MSGGQLAYTVLPWLLSELTEPEAEMVQPMLSDSVVDGSQQLLPVLASALTTACAAPCPARLTVVVPSFHTNTLCLTAWCWNIQAAWSS